MTLQWLFSIMETHTPIIDYSVVLSNRSKTSTYMVRLTLGTVCLHFTYMVRLALGTVCLHLTYIVRLTLGTVCLHLTYMVRLKLGTACLHFTLHWSLHLVESKCLWFLRMSCRNLPTYLSASHDTLSTLPLMLLRQVLKPNASSYVALRSAMVLPCAYIINTGILFLR